jgi:hypothetical protein
VYSTIRVFLEMASSVQTPDPEIFDRRRTSRGPDCRLFRRVPIA